MPLCSGDWELAIFAQFFPPRWARCPALSVSRCSLLGVAVPLTAPPQWSRWQYLGWLFCTLHAMSRTLAFMDSNHSAQPRLLPFAFFLYILYNIFFKKSNDCYLYRHIGQSLLCGYYFKPDGDTFPNRTGTSD